MIPLEPAALAYVYRDNVRIVSFPVGSRPTRFDLYLRGQKPSGEFCRVPLRQGISAREKYKFVRGYRRRFPLADHAVLPDGHGGTYRPYVPLWRDGTHRQ